MSATKSIAAKRINFGKVELIAEQPDLLGIQIQSFKDFFQLETTPDKRNNEGLFKVFKENFPITDTRNIFVLEFLDYFIDPPRYTIDECMERGLTYAVPLKAKDIYGSLNLKNDLNIRLCLTINCESLRVKKILLKVM
jgi:DNA-directed RNA polymerase subunit beta